MKPTTNTRIAAVLALAMLAFSSSITLAQDAPPSERTSAETKLVVASAITQRTSTSSPATNEETQDVAVAEALEGVLADTKLELEMRLSGLKSPILTADL